MKTLYLHIGTPKTATSSIQRFCRINRKKLSKYGYEFPIMPFSYSDISAARNAHFLAGPKADQNLSPKKEATFQKRLNDGFATVHSAFELCDNVILSDESIWRAINYTAWNPIQVLWDDAVSNGYAVKVIVYLRRQDSFLISRWNQQVKKNGLSSTYEENMEKIFTQYPLITDYAATLDIVAGIIGKENVIVRRFEPDTWIDHSIYADFLNALGLDSHLPLTIPEREINQGLKNNFFEIRRIINSDPYLTDSEKDHYGTLVRKMSNTTEDRYHYSMLSAEETSEILEQFREGNDKIANEYIGDGKPLFSDNIKDLPKWIPDNEYMPEDIIHFFTAVTTELSRENETLRDEIALLHKEYAGLKKNMDLFKYKLKHPFRTLWNRLFHKNKHAQK